MFNNFIKSIKTYKTEFLVSSIIFLQTAYFVLAHLGVKAQFLYFFAYSIGVSSYFLLAKRKPVLFFATICLLSLTIFVSISLNSQLPPFLLNYSGVYTFATSKIILLLFMYLPPLILLISEKMNCNIFAKFLGLYSFISLPLLIYVNYRLAFVNKGPYDYMAISYLLLFWSCVCFHWAVTRKRPILLFISLVSFVFIIIGGSRGSLICLSGFLVFYFAFFTKRASSKILFGVVVALLLLFILNIQQISNLLNSVLFTFGYSSRILSSLSQASFAESSGRDDIWNEVSLYIQNNPLGGGIFADVFATSGNNYAHNLILELFADFGWLGGFVLTACLFILVLKSFKILVRSIDRDIQFLIVFS